MSSYLKSSGHGATAPFTSAYGKARTPYQFTLRIALIAHLVGTAKVSYDLLCAV